MTIDHICIRDGAGNDVPNSNAANYNYYQHYVRGKLATWYYTPPDARFGAAACAGRPGPFVLHITNEGKQFVQSHPGPPAGYDYHKMSDPLPRFEMQEGVSP